MTIGDMYYARSPRAHCLSGRGTLTAPHLKSNTAEGHKAERLSHALYGLIIVTATLVAEQMHVTEVSDALGLLFGTALVLVLAHTYSSVMARRTIEGHSLGKAERKLVMKDNLPVVLAIIVPAALFLLAGMDLITLNAAYVTAIVFSLLSLFGLGIYEGRLASLAWVHSLLSGLAAGTIGLIVVAFEAFFE